MKHKLVVFVTAIAVAVSPVQKAQALFGLGDIVYDPTNHAENILTAARSLEQINNQVQQLANEAQMLINQAQNLANLPTSIAGELQGSLSQVDQLIRDAQGIAYDLSEIDGAYRELFPEEYADSVSTSDILHDARESWKLAREGFRHALEVQAEVVGEIRNDAATLDRLVGESQGAVGNLQAVQVGNQLTALAAKQSMQLQSLLAASARAEALDRADALAAHERGQARFERFMGDGSAYTRR
jgi:P-type conjugative transfer protein TrbJ